MINSVSIVENPSKKKTITTELVKVTVTDSIDEFSQSAQDECLELGREVGGEEAKTVN